MSVIFEPCGHIRFDQYTCPVCAKDRILALEDELEHEQQHIAQLRGCLDKAEADAEHHRLAAVDFRAIAEKYEADLAAARATLVTPHGHGTPTCSTCGVTLQPPGWRESGSDTQGRPAVGRTRNSAVPVPPVPQAAARPPGVPLTPMHTSRPHTHREDGSPKWVRRRSAETQECVT